MNKYNLDSMIKGWFVGDFEPTSYKTQDVEVAVKKYKKGDFELSHHHKIATEITVILHGKVLMNNIEYTDGDIIKLEPGESTDFVALDDSVNVVVKLPGAVDDKFID